MGPQAWRKSGYWKIFLVLVLHMQVGRSMMILSHFHGPRIQRGGVGGSILIVVVELQLLGSHPWQMIPLFVIVGMEKGGTTCPTYKHHNEQN